jgi:hypothetical protein
MRLDLWFRITNHLTLALACASMIYSEHGFLPGAWFWLLPFLALVPLAAVVEGHWTLPAWAANVLGVAIAGGSVCWIVTLFQDSDLSTISLPAALVPFLGPFLMALLLVKLFRPRTPGDFWLLQGMGLLQVGLGCVLTTGPLFGALVASYLACALPCLALHYFAREQAAASEQGQRQKAKDKREPEAISSPFSFFLFPFSLRWMLGAGLVGMVLFLALPRFNGQRWDPLDQFSSRPSFMKYAQTGFNDTIDLTRTGTVEINDDEAFTVTAVGTDGQPKADLPGDQRWRGAVLEDYSNGVWKSPQANGTFLPGQLSDFGPEQYFLDFTVQPRRAGGLFIAEPLRLGKEPLRVPLILLDEDKPQPPRFDRQTGTFLQRSNNEMFQRREHHYRQATAPLPDPDRRPAEPMVRGYLNRLAFEPGVPIPQPLVPITNWTRSLVKRLADEKRHGLTPEDVLPPLKPGVNAQPLVPMRWEPVARGLTDYLAHSGEYTYTLELRRQDETLDPALDFLKNVRQGHCDRYASALALMLRSMGIPARVVKGFRGVENAGDGTYVVRQSHAHSWVEALVPAAPPPDGEERPVAYYWLTLDPTADVDAPPPPPFSLLRWWQEGWRGGLALWQDLVVDYNADRQADVWEAIAPSRRTRGLLLGGMPILVGGLGVVLVAWRFPRLRRLLRRRASKAGLHGGVVPFYARLLALLDRHLGLRPPLSQTPREFADAVKPALRERPDTEALAELPSRTVGLFYRVRFGGRPLTADEAREVDARLDVLEAGLTGSAITGSLEGRLGR